MKEQNFKQDEIVEAHLYYDELVDQKSCGMMLYRLTIDDHRDGETEKCRLHWQLYCCRFEGFVHLQAYGSECCFPVSCICSILDKISRKLWISIPTIILRVQISFLSSTLLPSFPSSGLVYNQSILYDGVVISPFFSELQKKKLHLLKSEYHDIHFFDDEQKRIGGLF